MRRHISMEQLVSEVLTTARQTMQEKTASAAMQPKLSTEIGRLLVKVAEDVRNSPGTSLSYDDVAAVAEVRRAKYRAS